MDSQDSLFESTSGTSLEKPEEESKKFIELQKISVIETILTASIVAIVVSSLFYLTNANLYTTIAQFWFYFTFLIVPGGCFLLVLHAYTLFETYRSKKRVIPFVLDTTYFLYLLPSLATIFILGSLYTQYNISYKLYTPGWFIAVILLFVELALVFELSRYVTVTLLTKRFPNLIQPSQNQKIQAVPQPHRFKKPHRNMVYYLRKKPDMNQWSEEDSFVRYHHL